MKCERCKRNADRYDLIAGIYHVIKDHGREYAWCPKCCREILLESIHRAEWVKEANELVERSNKA